MDAQPEKQILIVDDEEPVREILARVARHEGVRAVGAENAGAARRLLERERFALVFSDLRMPGGEDGSHLIEWIRRNRPELPVVVVSAYADVDEETQSRSEANSNAVLLKPFQISEIAGLIRNLVKQ